MLAKFYAKSGGIYGIPFDHDSALNMVTKTILEGICVIGDYSCAGAMLCDFPFNYNAVIAHVLFWRFTKGRDVAVLSELAIRCRDNGATHINVSSLWPANTIGRVYRNIGLREIETQWLGELKKD